MPFGPLQKSNMRTFKTRLTLREYGKPVDLSTEICKTIRVDLSKANKLLIDAGLRAASYLGLKNNPISLDAGGARAVGFAGLLRLAPLIELEVVPKFLGADESDETWREDFFFLATLSKHGYFLQSEKLSSESTSDIRDLSTLLALSIISMYDARKRQPLRSYRRARETLFFIDGEPDPVDLFVPLPDGFEQELMCFDRRNRWNADIMAAVRELLPRMSDPSIISSLMRIIKDLSPQSPPRNRRKPVPARHRGWKPLHDLSVSVLNGLSISYSQGAMYAPGFLVSTWRIWEHLVEISLRLALGERVLTQKKFKLGTRNPDSDLSVYPDFVILNDENTKKIAIVDAKYKGNLEKQTTRISEQDVYESLAFCIATEINVVILLYPRDSLLEQKNVGHSDLFDIIEINDKKIYGFKIEIRQISQRGCLKNFSDGLLHIFKKVGL